MIAEIMVNSTKQMNALMQQINDLTTLSNERAANQSRLEAEFRRNQTELDRQHRANLTALQNKAEERENDLLKLLTSTTEKSQETKNMESF